ncbi:MAG: sulfur carrier protein ThiS [Thermoplasmata archaeon]|nr:sulfur carrier protein ThiS [Thermoplasmata archaeon]
MTIEVNGREIEFVEGETVTRLLKRMRYVFPLVVVKIDGTVIPRDRFKETRIPDNVEVEVMHLTSGG